MRSILMSTAALAALSTPTFAQTPVSELVITATRLPSSIELVTGARVIDRAEIEARQAVFATDLLATVPGVGVTRNGAFGGIAAIRIRGATADKTLVLIDGVPVDDPSDPNGTYDAASLTVADVERIEVLSGPQSSLWGSEAIGGVIAITSRELTGLKLDAEGGSFRTGRLFAGAGTTSEAYALGATLSAFRTDGISKAAGGREKDGMSTFTAGLNGRVAVSEAVTLDGRLRYSRADTDIDGYVAPAFQLGDLPDRYKSRSWSGLARAKVEGPWNLSHSLSLSAYDLDRTNVSSFPSRYTAGRQVWRWTAEPDDRSGPFNFVLGAEHDATKANLSGRPSLDLSSSSVFAVGRWHPAEGVTLTGSVRYDDPDRFEGRATSRLALAWEIMGGLTATVSAGQGFKTPTISQAVCDFCFPAGPAFDLKPETATGYDVRLGWSSPLDRATAAVTAYRLSVKDQIAYTGRYVNIARTRSNGVEAEGTFHLSDAITLKLAYAWMDAIDAASGASLLRVPDRSGAAALFWDAGPWTGALTVRGESSQADTALDGFSRTIREGFVTADLAGSYRMNDHVSLTARIENLADERYQETFGYAEPGRAVFVGVKLRD